MEWKKYTSQLFRDDWGMANLWHYPHFYGIYIPRTNGGFHWFDQETMCFSGIFENNTSVLNEET